MSRLKPSSGVKQARNPVTGGLVGARKAQSAARRNPGLRVVRNPAVPRPARATDAALRLDLRDDASVPPPRAGQITASPVPPVELWPPELVAEAELLLGWMVPRSALWLFVSNHNRRDEVVSLDAVIPQLRERIRKSTGGPTRIPTSGGDYVPPIGPAMEEETTLLLILLPRRLDDRLRSEVLDICLWYGWTTEQEEVLVLANNMKVLLPTGRLLDTMMVERALQLRGDVSRFLVPKPRSDSRRNGALPFLTRPRRPATGRG